MLIVGIVICITHNIKQVATLYITTLHHWYTVAAGKFIIPVEAIARTCLASVRITCRIPLEMLSHIR